MKINTNNHVYYALNGVFKLTNIQKLKLGNEEKECYVLNTINSFTTLFVPTNNLETLSKIKKILTKDEVKDYILNILKED